MTFQSWEIIVISFFCGSFLLVMILLPILIKAQDKVKDNPALWLKNFISSQDRMIDAEIEIERINRKKALRQPPRPATPSSDVARPEE